MLSLNRPMLIGQTTVFRDHANPNQFWYLPSQVAIRRDGSGPKFQLMLWKPTETGTEGGGFAMFESVVTLPPGEENRILARVASEPGVTGTPLLSQPPFDDGTVQCIAFDLQGSGGTRAADVPAGAFRATELILGASVPSMDARNVAAFSLKLDQDGAVIMRAAMTDGMAPVGVVYSLSYLAMRPALKVTITADFEQIYNHFSASIEAQYLFVKAGIEAALEWLASEGVIDIVVENFTGEADEAAQEKWALDFFKTDLLAKWFEPTLTVGTLATPAAKAVLPKKDSDEEESDGEESEDGESGGGESGGGDDGRESAGGGGAGRGGRGSGGGESRGGGSGGGSRDRESTERETTEGESARPSATRAPAVLARTSGSPDPLPEGMSVSHTPASSGQAETIVVRGTAAEVSVDGARVALSDGGVTVDVAPGSAHPVAVEWPGSSTSEEFALFFDFDKPARDGWDVQPASPEFRAYISNSTSDPRFQDATGEMPEGFGEGNGDGEWTGPERGADRLRSWIGDLPPGAVVNLKAMASHEHGTQPDEAARTRYNQALSQRRLDVARAIITQAGGTVGSAVPLGDTEPDDRPGTHSPMGGDPDNRVVQVSAAVAGAGSTWNGTISRPATEVPDEPEAPEEPAEPETPGEPEEPAEPETPEEPAEPETPDDEEDEEDKDVIPKIPDVDAAVAFRLKFVRQEERKKLTLRYDRSEAVRRVYAPQGFLGLLVSDLDDTERFFKEISLDDSFFREMTITVRTATDFDAIGLFQADVNIDYGDSDDIENHTSRQLVFTPSSLEPQSTSFRLNQHRDLDYDARMSFDFAPQQGWESDRAHYEVLLPGIVDRDLVINPFEHIEFREIAFEAGVVDFGVVTSLDVRVEAQGYATPEPRAVLHLTQADPRAVFRIRGELAGAASRSVIFTVTQNLDDGTSTTSPVQVATEDAVLVHDRLDGALDLTFVPQFDTTAVSKVFVDIEYRDEANVYVRKFHEEVPATQTDPLRVHIALRDPDLRNYSFRMTFSGPGLFDRRAFVDTTETLIALV